METKQSSIINFFKPSQKISSKKIENSEKNENNFEESQKEKRIHFPYEISKNQGTMEKVLQNQRKTEDPISQISEFSLPSQNIPEKERESENVLINPLGNKRKSELNNTKGILAIQRKASKKESESIVVEGIF